MKHSKNSLGKSQRFGFLKKGTLRGAAVSDIKGGT
jgi:hypothetical protein